MIKSTFLNYRNSAEFTLRLDDLGGEIIQNAGLFIVVYKFFSRHFKLFADILELTEVEQRGKRGYDK